VSIITQHFCPSGKSEFLVLKLCRKKPPTDDKTKKSYKQVPSFVFLFLFSNSDTNIKYEDKSVIRKADTGN